MNAPGILLTIQPESNRVALIRLESDAEVEPEDAQREDIIVPAVHVQAVLEALALASLKSII